MLQQALALSSNTTYTLSVSAENIDLQLGSPTVVRIYGLTSVTGDTIISMADFDNSERVSITFRTGNDGIGTLNYGLGASGDAIGEITMAGIQLEAGSLSTSFIPTGASTESRPYVATYVDTPDLPMTTEGAAGRIILTPYRDTAEGAVFHCYTSPSVGYFTVHMGLTAITLSRRNSEGLTSVLVPNVPVAGEQIVIDFKSDSTGLALSVADIGETPRVDADPLVADLVLYAWTGIGSAFGGNHIDATIDSVKVFADSTDAASFLNDWSL
jgi:hypothetical protein